MLVLNSMLSSYKIQPFRKQYPFFYRCSFYRMMSKQQEQQLKVAQEQQIRQARGLALGRPFNFQNNAGEITGENPQGSLLPGPGGNPVGGLNQTSSASASAISAVAGTTPVGSAPLPPPSLGGAPSAPTTAGSGNTTTPALDGAFAGNSSAVPASAPGGDPGAATAWQILQRAQQQQQYQQQLQQLQMQLLLQQMQGQADPAKMLTQASSVAPAAAAAATAAGSGSGSAGPVADSDVLQALQSELLKERQLREQAETALAQGKKATSKLITQLIDIEATSMDPNPLSQLSMQMKRSPTAFSSHGLSSPTESAPADSLAQGGAEQHNRDDQAGFREVAGFRDHEQNNDWLQLSADDAFEVSEVLSQEWSLPLVGKGEVVDGLGHGGMGRLSPGLLHSPPDQHHMMSGSEFQDGGGENSYGRGWSQEGQRDDNRNYGVAAYEDCFMVGNNGGGGIRDIKKKIPVKPSIEKRRRSPSTTLKPEVEGQYAEYICGYCNAKKVSMSTANDGHVRIRCKCGGKHGDKVARMHAKWTILPHTVSNRFSIQPKALPEP